MKFNTIPEAIEAIRNGEMIIVSDDPDRENEGDLIMAAEKATPEAVNFMAKYGRGMICLARHRGTVVRVESSVDGLGKHRAAAYGVYSNN